MIGLGVRVGDAADIFQHILRLRLGHRLGVRVVAEQFRGYLIDALVSALRTQDHCNEQLEHTAELQFGIYIGHLLAEVSQNPGISFFFSHNFCKDTKKAR